MDKTNLPFSEEAIRKQQEKILSDQLFGSEKNRKLLEYLVNKSLEGHPPKEATIAVELYNADLQQESDTSFVRVAVYHLRKRLNEYFLTSGKDDEIRYTIEKGSYEVQFSSNKQADAQNQPTKNRWIIVLSVAIVLLLAYQVLDLTSDPSESDIRSTMLHQDLTSNNKPVLVVLGDLFMYHDEYGNLVRDYDINSQQELEEKKPQLSSDEQSRSKYLTRLHAISLYNFSNLLSQLPQDVNFRMGSELSIEDIMENNIIFIGFFKSMYLLNSYYKLSGFEPAEDYSYLLHRESGDTISITGNPGELHKDYGIFSKITGPQDNFIYVIAGFTDTSVELISSSVMDPNFLQREVLKKGNPPQSFEILFEVDGYDRKQLSNIKVVAVNEILDSSQMWE